MSLPAPTPPLLLTKRLTYFLRSNLSAQIHTALLATLSGKLLAHASLHPVSTLRTQSTVAASIWSIYSAPAAQAAIPEALPPHTSKQDAPPSAVTIQLATGVLVVRKLRCGLLFISIGPSPDGAGAEPDAASTSQAQSQPVQTPQTPTTQSHPASSAGSPSEVESVVSTGAATLASITTTGSVGAAGVVLMRRQAEELAKWLDDKLGSLGVPEEGVGVDVR